MVAECRNYSTIRYIAIILLSNVDIEICHFLIENGKES